MFARQTAKIFPLIESETSETSEITENTETTETTEEIIEMLSPPFLKVYDEDLSKKVLYSIMDELLQRNSFCNEFGVIDLSNIDEFEIDLFESKIKGEENEQTYGFKVCPKGCMMSNDSMCDGIVSNHCNHNIEYWYPLFHPTMDTKKEKLVWFVFANSSFSL